MECPWIWTDKDGNENNGHLVNLAAPKAGDLQPNQPTDERTEEQLT